MIFVDANVVMYAIGAPSTQRDAVRQRLSEVQRSHGAASAILATSAEVVQELMHRYLTVGRTEQLDNAMRLVGDLMTVWPVDFEDMLLARRLADRHPALTARDLVHLATCVHRGVDDLWTYDRGLAAVWKQR